MFLRQAEIFYQYQKYYDELNYIQYYLKSLIDQLPIGILISTDALTLHYVNEKMEDEMMVSFSEHLGQSIYDLPLSPEILVSILTVMESGEENSQQITIPIMNRSEAYVLNSFKPTIASKSWVVSVLTSINNQRTI